MSHVLVDSNVILDVLTEDPTWFGWSSEQLIRCADQGSVWINPIIYAEISVGFSQKAEIDEVLPESFLQRADLPYEAGFLAGQAFLAYRQRGGERRSPLPDFYIGAHAVTVGYSLLTRDSARYQTYFPGIFLISP